MTSNFGWVDFASENREKMMDVVNLFREKDTVDELGIGTIRDAFADYFFPGTSTIQTRAKYMLFIPWIYQKIEQKEITYPKVNKRARRYEIKLINALLKSDDVYGVIGREAKSDLERLPSEIYWAGLSSWGIRLSSMSKSQYHRSLTNRYYQKKRNLELDQDQLSSRNWHQGLPSPPNNLFDHAEFKLNYQEAEYLEDRIACNHKNSLLSYLINLKNEVEAEYFWHLPLVHELPSELKKNIDHSRNFSETIHGAFLYYNFLLAKERQNEELIGKYNKKLEEWKEKMYSRWDELSDWHQNLDDFWKSRPISMGNVGYSTRSFLKQWLEFIFVDRGIRDLQGSQKARQLIENREKEKKGSRARLHNSRALERWDRSSSPSQLGFRWEVSQTIISDIVAGLNRGGK